MQEGQTTDTVAGGPDAGSTSMPSLEATLNDAHLASSMPQSSVGSPMPSAGTEPVTQLGQSPTPPSPNKSVGAKYALPILIGAGLICAIIVIAAIVMRTRQSQNAQLQSVADASNYNQTAVPLAEISASEKLSPTLRVYESAGSLFTVNGDFSLNGRAIVSAVSRPVDPQPGELWFQQDSKKLYFYDGTNYVDITYAQTVNSDLQALTAKLQNVVTSVQNASGNITLNAGTGIGVSGTTITNTGVVSLQAETPDLTITDQGNGRYTISSTPGTFLQPTTPGIAQTGNINITGTAIAAAFSGSGASLTNLNASSITTGTLDNNRLDTSVVTLQGNTFNGNSQLVKTTSTGTLPILSAVNLTNLDAAQISLGTLTDNRLSGNVALLSATQTFIGYPTFRNTTNSTSAFQIQNSAGTGNLFIANTTNGRIGIGKSPSLGVLDVNGAIYQNGNQVCDSSGNCGGGPTAGTLFDGGNSLGAPLTVGTNDNYGVNIEVNNSTVASFATGGAATFRNTTNSTSAFQIQNTAGTSNLFIADTTNGRIAIGQATASYPLDVAGDINTTGTFRINGTPICTTVGCAPAPGNDSYLQLQATTPGSPQTGNLYISGTAIAGTFSGSGASLTSLNATNISSGTVADARLSANVALLNGTGPQTFSGNNRFNGTLLVRTATDAVGSFQIQNAAGGSNLFVADTTNSRIGIGVGTPAYTLDVAGDVNITGAYRINGTAVCTSSGCTPTSDGSNYVQLQATSPGTQQTGNLNISGTGMFGTALSVRTATNSTTAFQVQNAAGSNVLAVDTVNNTLTVRGGVTATTFGSSLVSGNFTSGWTGTGWTLASSTATHVSGTTALTPTGLTIVPGNTYRVSYSFIQTVGYIFASFGGVTLDNYDGSVSKSVTQFITATNSNTLSFAPTSGTSNAVISGVSVSLVTTGSPVLAVLDSAGASALQVRIGQTQSSSSLYIGRESGLYASTGTDNTAVGAYSLRANSGSNNNAFGANALYNNNTGSNNSAFGRSALYDNTGGYENTAFGNSAGYGITTGYRNVAIGVQALRHSPQGYYNTALGYVSGYEDGQFTSGSNLINTTTLGAGTISTQSNTVIIGNSVVANNSVYSGLEPVNVGIGTPAPTNRLSVSPAYGYGNGGNWDDGCLGGYLAQSGSTVSFDGVGECGGIFSATDVGAEIVWQTGQKAIITRFISSTQVIAAPAQTVANGVYKLFYSGLQVTSSGTVGVGTASPSTQLEVVVQGSATRGALTVNNRSSTGNILNLQDANGTVALVADGGATSFLNSVNSTAAFSVGGVGSVTQRPAQAINGGVVSTFITALSLGYSFTPNTSGTITQLGARNLAGTYIVTLYQNGTILASTDVTATGTGTWVYANIAPVNVVAGSQYVVALYSTGGNYMTSNGFVNDTLTGNITVNRSLFASGYTVPTNISFGQMAGQPDITFVPAQTLLSVDTTNAKTIFGRATDGTILDFRSGSTVQGTIAVSGSTVSYNAFTGSHYGLFAPGSTAATRGELVDLTGSNQYKQGSAEPYYGITRAATANSPNILGAYLGTTDPSTSASLDNPELIMAAGNGDVWIADNGSGNVMIGDPLISSGDVPGHAMRDTKSFPTSHIFAKSAEAIDWDTITTTVGGTKVAKVTVLFSYYNQDNQNTLAQDLQGGSLNITGNSILIGNLSVIGNINVSGTTTLATLIVTGNVTIQQNLTVEGNTTIAGNLTVGGKIITRGATPEVLASSSSGNGAAVTITGNDTAGSVVLTTGTSGVISGKQALVTFVANYDTAPRIALTAKDSNSAAMRYYVETTVTGFVVHFIDTPTANSIYSFDYILLQ